jgi:hypothetical protein
MDNTKLPDNVTTTGIVIVIIEMFSYIVAACVGRC